MIVRFFEVAQAELEQAVVRYNSECPGFGFEFADEIDRSIERIKENPDAWQCLSKHLRRCITRRFPYGIVYTCRDQEVLIIGILHLHRHPDTWRDRTL